LLGDDVVRPKEFNREEALLRAIEVFAQGGYGGTSTEALRAAMGIGRQSFYDTFISKHALYLEALQRYNRDQATQIVHDLSSGDTPLDGLTRVLSSFVDRCEKSEEPACLGTSAIFEFGRRDPMVVEAIGSITDIVLKPLVRGIKQAQIAKQVRKDIDADLAAHFLLATLGGLKISARAGMPIDQLRKIGALALQALR
jgi:TetR/AcrR family transcriptional regulator, transcriptional repressor for nem operon